MRTTTERPPFRELTGPGGEESTDLDYLAWKEEKIRKALKQAEDRSLMIPADKVWEKFGFER